MMMMVTTMIMTVMVVVMATVVAECTEGLVATATAVAKSKITMYSKPFERKDNKAPYDGKVGGALWKTKTINFLVTRAPEMVAAIEWTERQEGVIDEDKLKEFGESKTWRRCLGGDTPTDSLLVIY